ncbi:MAG: mismatch-specific DNA-glycosylase [Actinomycetota bacterium]
MDARTIARRLRVAPEDLPLALAALHAALPVGATWSASLAGRAPEALVDVVEGGGFTVVESVPTGRARARVVARRDHTLPDFVGSGLRLLVVGCNPSLRSADAGVGFARPGNRFWPAALEAGIVSADRDPWRAVRTDRVGMTDLVKRATNDAAAVRPDEYRRGLARVERLVAWLGPGAVCVLGVEGWRTAADPRARPGVQPGDLGGRPVYLMPNPSGRNAHATVASLAAHLRAARALADDAPSAQAGSASEGRVRPGRDRGARAPG